MNDELAIVETVLAFAGDGAQERLIYQVCTQSPENFKADETLFKVDPLLGYSTFQLAIFLDQADIFPVMMASPNFKLEHFINAFFLSAELGKVKIIKQLLAADKCPNNILNIQDGNKYTPLQLAAKNL